MATNTALDGRMELTDDAAPTQVIEASGGSPVVLPEGLSPTTAEFSHSGPDLVMEWPDGSQVVVRDYFAGDTQPEIQAPGGASLEGDLVSQLAGPVAPGQTAQAGTGAAEQPIGQVEQVEGSVFAVRADGTRVELQEGSPVYQGDILESSADGSVGVILADETTFSMSENGRMVLDEMVYDPATQEGSISMSVVEGVFTFVSGQVAKTDPDAMTLNTPVATIGIRGTQVGIDLTNPEDAKIVLMEEGDGFVGEVVIKNDAGVVVMNGANDFTSIRGFEHAPAEVRQADPREVAESFGSALKSLPTNGNNVNNYGVQKDGTVNIQELQEKTTAPEEATPISEDTTPEEEVPVEDLAEFETAAGEPAAEPEAPADAPIIAEATNTPTNNEPAAEDFGFAPTTTTTTATRTGAQGTGGTEAAAPPPPPPPAEAQAPTLSVSSASGQEDGQVGLNIEARLNDTDGAETLRVTVSGVPEGATLSAGTDNGDGTWTLTSGDLSGLTMTPPADFNGDLSLTVTATATETTGEGDSTSVSSPLAVSIAPVGDAPTVTATSTRGVEDTDIGLDISVAMSPDTTETVDSITVGGVPSGATLSAGTDNGDGTWTLTPDQLAGLKVTPPANFSGEMTFTVTAVSSDGTESAKPVSMDVGVTGDADTPTLTLGSVTGAEDSAIALDISAGLTDTDGSESLSVTISGVPDGASLSAGTDNGDGTWTLTSGDLDGLSLTPPADFYGDLNLNVVATATESNGDQAMSSAGFTVNVTPVSDIQSVTGSGSGAEDTGINLNITAVMNEGTTETVESVTIAGVPDGASLSAGTDNGDGTWTLTADDLSGLQITPPANFSGEMALTVSATTTDGAVADAPVTVAVSGVADAPTLTVGATAGAEDSAIALDISAGLTDTDGSETLSITIAGVPDGASLSAGTDNGDGTWTLTSGDLAGLQLTPPQDYSGTLNLSVTATSSEDGTTAEITGTLNVTVEQVGDGAIVVGSGAGAEDSAIDLNISATMDAGTTETVDSITIAGVPDGASLSAGTDNGDGTWTLTADDLSGLQITPPANFSGEMALTVSATTTDGTVTDAPVTVAVSGVADAPTLTVGAATGAEDSAIALDISAGLTDTDGSETLSVTISGVPTGASLSAGTDNGDGTWTLTSGDLDGLSLTPPADFYGDLNLNVVATATESNGDQAMSSAGFTVNVTPVSDIQSVTGSGSGAEDTGINLNITAVMNEGTTETVDSVTVSGVPIGASLSAGTDNGDGSWTLTADDLSGLQITPPEHFSGSINLGVTATSSDGGTVSTLVNVDVAGVADAPLVSLSVGEPTVINAGDHDRGIGNDPNRQDSDNPHFGDGSTGGDGGLVYPVNISASLVDTDGSESLSITVSGLPQGATLSAGTDNGDGSWTLDPSQLTGLTMGVPAGASEGFTLSVTATSTETNGDTASSVADATVGIDSTASAPTLTLNNVEGEEDGAVILDLSAGLTDTDGSETLSISISGLPLGASLSAGTDNGDGSWTLTADDLTGLVMFPPQDYSGDMNLSVTATSTEFNGGATASTSGTVTVAIAPVADAATVTGYGSGAEDAAIDLNIAAVMGDDTTETVDSVTIAGVPDGASLSAGTDNGDGTWTLTPGDLTGLQITPPANFSGEMALTVSATTTDGTVTDAPVTVAVSGVADAPTLTVGAAAGAEDSAIALDISAGLTDTDGSETLSITIAGVPDGASLSAGTDNGDGTWTLTSGDLAGLQLTPPQDYSGTLNLSVTATSSEDGTTAETTGTLNVTVEQVGDGAIVVGSGAGAEDSAIDLNISATMDAGTTETVDSVTISGVPDGASLSAGTDNGDGTWTLTPGDLAGLQITPPANFSGEMALTVSATTTDGTVTDAPVTVAVSGVADAPTLTVGATAGAEDSAIALDISAGLTDTDGSETLSITIAGVPDGASLSAGTDNGDGTWTLSADDLAGLQLTPPQDYSGTLNLSVTATSSEGGTTAETTGTLNVTVEQAGDGAIVVGSGAGAEDTAIDLNISATMDAGTTETVESVTVAGVPDGVSLSAGTDNGDGTWTLTADDLSGLQITPPQDFNGDISLDVSATSTDGTVTSAPVTVSVSAVADAATVTASAGPASEDVAVNLNITAAMDADTSETVDSITIAGVPDGASLSAGTDNGDGTWTLTSGDLAGLQMAPPQDYNGPVNLTISVTTTDGTQTETGLDFDIAAVGDAVNLSAGGSGLEDGGVPLDITATMDADTAETVDSITVTGVPTGASLSAGTDLGGGSWSLTAGDLEGLTLNPPANFNGDINLGVSATSTDGTLSIATATVSVGAVNDAPTDISFSDTNVDENTAVGMVVATLSATDVDTQDEGSTESFTFSIVDDPDGMFAIDGNNLVVAAVPDYETSQQHTVTVQVTDAAGASYQKTVTIDINDIMEGTPPNQIIFDDRYVNMHELEAEGTSDADEIIMSGEFVNIKEVEAEGKDGDDIITMSGDFNNIREEVEAKGGSGDDTITMSGDFQNVEKVEAEGGKGDDTLTLSGDFNNVDKIDVEGGEGADDILLSGNFSNIDKKIDIEGGSGDDTITLTGNFEGVDKIEIEGGSGDDIIDLSQATFTNVDEFKIEGGKGDDIIIGGEGSETFVFDKDSGDDIIRNLMEQDTIEFDGKTFDKSDMIFAEEEGTGDVVISFQGNDDMSVTLEGVKFDTLDTNADGTISEGEGYTVSDDGCDGLSVTINVDQNN